MVSDNRTEFGLVRDSKWTFGADGMPSGLAISVFNAVDAARQGDTSAWERLRGAYDDASMDAINEAAAIREAYWKRVDAA